MEDERSASIPNHTEIIDLPIWAQVAFAARCLARVVSLFDTRQQQSESQLVHQSQIRPILMFMQDCAAKPSRPHAEIDLQQASIEVHGLLEATDHQGAPLVHYFLLGVKQALFALESALGVVPRLRGEVADGADKANLFASNSVTAQPSNKMVRRSHRRDFELLLALSEREGWTDDTPVPPEVFGPMWPEGEPEGWPEDESDKPDPFSFVLDPGDAAKETIQEVLSALSDLHEAHTGYAVTYEIEGSRVHACVEEQV